MAVTPTPLSEIERGDVTASPLTDAERLAGTLRVDAGMLDLVSDYQVLSPMDRLAVCKLARILAGRTQSKPST